MSKSELLEGVWPQQYVSESALVYCVMTARKVLGDDGSAQQVIKTIRGRGYRFIAPVQERPRAVGLEAVQPVVQATSSVVARRVTGAERRQLSVLVARLVPATPPVERLDPEDLRDLIQHAQELCTEVVRHYEGHITQYLGDGFVVYFGYPKVHEDDACRAVHTGLGMLAGVTQLNARLAQESRVKLAVRVGVHTGHAVVDTAASGIEPAPLALSDVPNTALQLQGLATPNAMLISAATMRLVEGYFVCQPLGPYALEDAAQPAVVYQVLAASPARGRLDATMAMGLTPLVGREHEVGLLLERWERAKEGMGQVALLSGEAGIGKSRLAHVLREHVVHDRPVEYAYRCSPYAHHSPLAPVIEQLQQRLQLHRDDDAVTKLGKLEVALASCGVPLDEAVPYVATLLSIPWSEGYAAPEVERAYARARELCKRLGDTPQLFPVLHGLVRFYLVRGELQTARELAEECLTLAQRVQDPALLLEAQGHLAVTLFYSGELAPAQSLLEQVRQLYHAEQHRAHAFLYGQEPGVSCYGYLSIVLWLRGYPTQARQCCHDMLALAQEQAHPYSLTFASFLATWLYQMCGDLAGMSQHAETTMALAAEHGFPLLLGMGQRFWGWGLVEQGQADEGLRQMTAGMAAFRLTGAETALTYTQVRLAEAYQRTHQVAEARQALDDAVRAMAKGERFYTAEVYRLQGEFALSAGGQEAALRAEDWWHRAIEVAQQQQARALELRAVISLTRLWQQQGKRRQAYQRLAESYDGFTEGFDTADLQAAQALLEQLR